VPSHCQLLASQLAYIHYALAHPKPNQTKPNQTKPNQTKPNQTKPNQTKPNQTPTHTPRHRLHKHRWLGPHGSRLFKAGVGKGRRRSGRPHPEAGLLPDQPVGGPDGAAVDERPWGWEPDERAAREQGAGVARVQGWVLRCRFWVRRWCVIGAELGDLN